MKGRIVKALADFYYVYSEGEVYQCKAKGLFRKNNMTPLVGDEVAFELTHAQDIEGNVTEIFPRKSKLSRPSVANIDMILLVFAALDPEPNLYLLDRFLAIMEHNGLETTIVFNKTDLCSAIRYKSLYDEVGYKCILASVNKEHGLDEIKVAINGKAVSVAGPSGVGKSSIINALSGRDVMETGNVSKKNRRGKQTTRHTELIPLWENTFIVDTPGFSSTDINAIPKEELAGCMPDFRKYLGGCRFSTCSHTHEPDCSVKAAVDEGQIHLARYENYCQMYEELKAVKKY